MAWRTRRTPATAPKRVAHELDLSPDRLRRLLRMSVAAGVAAQSFALALVRLLEREPGTLGELNELGSRDFQ